MQLFCNRGKLRWFCPGYSSIVWCNTFSLRKRKKRNWFSSIQWILISYERPRNAGFLSHVETEIPGEQNPLDANKKSKVWCKPPFFRPQTCKCRGARHGGEATVDQSNEWLKTATLESHSQCFSENRPSKEWHQVICNTKFLNITRKILFRSIQLQSS